MNLFIALMYPNKDLAEKSLNSLIREFGPLKNIGKPFDFNFTTYYEPEFGKDLKKIFLIFEKELKKTDLIGIRKKTAEIEASFKIDNKRTINIDPGYISSTELTLATVKGKPWKELLGDNIYAHKVLEFKGDEIITFNHTFADYKQNLEFFKKLRNP